MDELNSSPSEIISYQLDEIVYDYDLEYVDVTEDNLWYVNRRRSALGLPLVAAPASKWNPNLHPRGRDGKFISVGGFVKFIRNGKWHKGKVVGIDADNGEVKVVFTGSNGVDETVVYAHPSKGLYAAQTPKATMKLPDISKSEDAGFVKIGGQGGSNPGALFAKQDTDAIDLSNNAQLVYAALAGKNSIVRTNGLPETGPGNLTGTDGEVPIGDNPEIASAVSLFLDEVMSDFISSYAGDNEEFAEYLRENLHADVRSYKGSDVLKIGLVVDTLEYDDDLWSYSGDISLVLIAPNSFVYKVDASQRPPDDITEQSTPMHSVEFMQSSLADLGSTLGVPVTTQDIENIPAVDLQKDRFYVKKSKSKNHAANEVLANDLYKLGGVPTPDVFMGDDEVTVGSKILTGEREPISKATPEQLSRVREDMVFDAWLANWDVIGLSYDNIVLMNGLPTRIDAGGSLLYRAQGSPKGSMFGDTVSELQTLRDSSKNPQAHMIFGPTTNGELIKGAERLAAIDPALIKEYVMNSGVDNPEDLTNTLLARRTYILDKLGVPDKWAFGSSESTAKAVVPDAVKEKPEKPKPAKSKAGKIVDPPEVNSNIEILEELSIEEAVALSNSGAIPPDEKVLITFTQTEYSTSPPIIGAIDKAGLSYHKLPMIRVMPLKSIDASPSTWGIEVQKDGSSNGRIFRIKQLDLQTLSPGKATLKSDGSLVVKKKVVGSWKKNQWSSSVTWSILPEFSITGKEMERKTWGKGETAVTVSMYALVEGDAVPIDESKKIELPPGEISPNIKVLGETIENPTPELIEIGSTYLVQRGYWPPIVAVAQKGFPGSDNSDTVMFSPLADPDDTFSGSLPGLTYTVSSAGYGFEADKLTKIEPLSEDLDPALASMKPDGTIVSKGQVIGVYWSQYNAGSYTQYTVFAAYTADGKNYTRTAKSKADARLEAMSVAIVPTLAGPGDVPKKSASKSLQSATEKVSGLTVDGKPVVVGTKVTHIDSGITGTVTNWPNQEKYPNLVYVTTDDGTKKTITVKKLKLSEDEVVPGAYGTTAFAGLKTADGKTPVAGQKIKTGKAGLVGTLVKVNEKNGYVTVLLDDGTKKTTTLATTYVLEEPSSDTVASTATSVAKVSSKAISTTTPNYSLSNLEVELPGQDDESKAKFLAKGKRKLMADGSVPYVGMSVVDKSGNKYLVAEIPDKWSSSPNGIKLIPVGSEYFSVKVTTKQTNTLSVDVEAENNKGIGVKSVWIQTQKYGGDLEDTTIELPVGALVLRRESKSRNDLGQIVVILPDGKYYSPTFHGSGPHKLDKAQMLNWITDPDWQIVARGDSSSTKSYVSTAGTKYNTYQGDVLVQTSLVSTSFVYDEADIVEGTSVEKLIADFNQNKLEQSGLSVPEHVSIGNPLIPPPIPEELKTKVKIDFPQPSGEQKQNFKRKPLIPKAMSVSDAVADVLKDKDSTEPGTSVSFATLDSVSLVDQQVRFQVVIGPDGTQYVETRLKLSSSAADAIGTKIVSSETKTGAWVGQNVTVKDLVDGDAITVREGTTAGNKVLKPYASNQPNARIVGEPVKVADAQGPGTYDTYRFKVVMSTGEVGEVDIQDRSADGGVVVKYEYDWTKVLPGVALGLTTDAEQEGWARLGHNGQFPVSSVDETGKKIYSSFSSISQSTPDGSMLSRQLSDGTLVRFNYAHPSEGEDSYRNPRWRTTNNEVIIMTPISSDPEVIEKSVSDVMEVLGVSDDAQVPPTPDDIKLMAMRKLAWQFDKNWKPGKPYEEVTANPNDPGTKALLADVGAQIKLGRPLEMSDLRVYTEPDGRVFIGLSDEAAKALAKAQGITHYRHNISGHLIDMIAHPVNGLLSTDERWSRGILTTGMSSSTDMSIGSGDRVYLRAGAGSPGGAIVLNPTAVNRSLDSYSSSSDGYGSKHQRWSEGYTSGNNETMYKGRIIPEMFGYVLVSDPDTLIKELKDKGVTMIGTRKVEDIVKKKDSVSAKDLENLGLDFDDGVPLTSLGGE